MSPISVSSSSLFSSLHWLYSQAGSSLPLWSVMTSGNYRLNISRQKECVPFAMAPLKVPGLNFIGLVCIRYPPLTHSLWPREMLLLVRCMGHETTPEALSDWGRGGFPKENWDAFNLKRGDGCWVRKKQKTSILTSTFSVSKL